MILMPKYPVYVPTKGRADRPKTAQILARAEVPFRLVVEPQDVEAYSKEWGAHLLVMPENDQGLVYARNFIWDHAVAEGHEKHWQFDDDILNMVRLVRGYRMWAEANVALGIAEEFVDRYENVGLFSFNSDFFVSSSRGRSRQKWPPFYLNTRCYTNFLINHALPLRFRRLSTTRSSDNEDTDMSLQVLAIGWCTILFNAFMMKTPETMAAKGGQTTFTYAGDGLLHRSRNLERVWPGVVTTDRRYGRPQHHIKNHWQLFDTPLKRKPGVEIPEGVNEFGMVLRQKADIPNPHLAQVAKELGAVRVDEEEA